VRHQKELFSRFLLLCFELISFVAIQKAHYLNLKFILIAIAIVNVISILNTSETEIGNGFALDYRSANREFVEAANKSAIGSANDHHYCRRSLHGLEYTPLRPSIRK
jgi:hypothetical protein